MTLAEKLTLANKLSLAVGKMNSAPTVEGPKADGTFIARAAGASGTGTHPETALDRLLLELREMALTKLAETYQVAMDQALAAHEAKKAIEQNEDLNDLWSSQKPLPAPPKVPGAVAHPAVVITGLSTTTSSAT